MKIKIFRNSGLSEDRVEIYCRGKNRQVDKIVHFIKESSHEAVIGILDGIERVVAQEDLYYFESVDKKCYGYSHSEVYQIKSTLANLESLLNTDLFVRVNKSMILNICKVQSIQSDLNMRTMAVLHNGEQAVISRHYQKNFKSKLYGLRDRLQEQKYENH